MKISGGIISQKSGESFQAITRSFHTNLSYVSGFYYTASNSTHGGVIQMREGVSDRQTIFSSEPLDRVYMLKGDNNTPGCLDVVILKNKFQSKRVPLSVINSLGFTSEVHQVLVGVEESNFSNYDTWLNGWDLVPSVDTIIADSWEAEFLISVNDRNFPESNLITSENMDVKDLESLMTGVYASASGALCTGKNSPGCPKAEGNKKQFGFIATTIARPDRGYGGTYNYFDPDNYISTSALIYSGDLFLQDQARYIIEQNGDNLCVGDVLKTGVCSYGQMLHHWEGIKPTYLALSGATQTGPNIFWTLSALQYAKNTRDINWLKNYMPTLRISAAFCFNLIDPNTHMILAPGVYYIFPSSKKYLSLSVTILFYV